MAEKNVFDPAEIAKYASLHSKLRKAPEPKDVFTEEDVLNHLYGKAKEKAEKDVWFAATLQSLFKLKYDYNYYLKEKEGLTQEDVENELFSIHRNIEMLVQNNGYELKPEDKETELNPSNPFNKILGK